MTVVIDSSMDKDLEKAFWNRVWHYTKEVLSLIGTGFVVVGLYTLLTRDKSNTGDYASKALDQFIEHCVSSVNVSLVSLAIFVLGIAVMIDGSMLSDTLQKYVVNPLLNLFQHSCALTLGVVVAYLGLIALEIKSHQERGGALLAMFMLFMTLGLLISLRAYFEIRARSLCEEICIRVITLTAKVFPKIISSPEQLHANTQNILRRVFMVLGFAIAVLAIRQLGDDLEKLAKFSHTTAEACSTNESEKK